MTLLIAGVLIADSKDTYMYQGFNYGSGTIRYELRLRMEEI
jgi:hypothetical protein